MDVRWSGFDAGGGVGKATIAHHAKLAGADLSEISRRHRPQELARPMAGAQAPTGPAETDPRTTQMAAALLSGSSAIDLSPPNWLVKHWIEKATLSVLYGESNTGKSFVAFDMAAHLAAGNPWQGYRTGAPVDVVYVAGEGDLGLKRRLAAFAREHPDFDLSRLHVLPMRLDLHEGGDAERLIQILGDAGIAPAFIVIDTLAQSMGGGDENTATDMTRFVGSCAKLKAELGAHVMVIHQSGKDTSKGARSSSVLRAAVDAEFEVTSGGGVSTLSTRKQRDTTKEGELSYRLKSVTLGVDEDDEEYGSAVIEPCERPRQSKAEKLSPQMKLALRQLDEAIAEKGEVKADVAKWPRRRVVPVSVWRDYCERADIAEGDAALRTLMPRAKRKLQEAGLIVIQDGHVWSIGDEDS